MINPDTAKSFLKFGVVVSIGVSLAACNVHREKPNQEAATDTTLEIVETASNTGTSDTSGTVQVAKSTVGEGDGAGSGVEQEPPPNLSFFDSYAFDVDLSSALRDDHVVLPVNTTFDLNNIPDRMDNWFERIIKEGGKVQARPLQKDGDLKTRGILGAIIDLIIEVTEAAEREVLYGPVDEYDAILHFDDETKEVAYVEFVKR